MNDSATPRPIFMTWFILTIPKTFFAMHACSRKGEHSREVERGESQSLGRCDASKVPIDGTTPFVICSKGGARGRMAVGRMDDDGHFNEDGFDGGGAGRVLDLRMCARCGA